MIAWPEDVHPERAIIHVHNELETDLPPERIWPWLVHATRWRELYTNCHGLRFLGESGPDLRMGTHFSWWTFGVPVTTIVEEFVPYERLAWRGEGLGARGYHAWSLERRGERTRFVTEETQDGVAPRLLRFALRPALLHFHQRWLEGLVSAAHLGSPEEVKVVSNRHSPQKESL